VFVQFFRARASVGCVARRAAAQPQRHCHPPKRASHYAQHLASLLSERPANLAWRPSNC
jgi:hypothetical protein